MPTLDRLRLLGTHGSRKLMAGEFSRLLRRALPPEKNRALLNDRPEHVGAEGLGYPFSVEVAEVAVTYHRTAARALWDLYESRASRLEPLYEELYQLIQADRRPWLFQSARISVLAFHPRSVEAGERQIVGVVKNALLDGARAQGIELTVDAENPDLIFQVRSHEDEEGAVLTLSLDLAGRPLHQRGYRTLSGEAPIREDLAALLVLLTRHDPRRECLIDPMAGAGTILVEAAHLAAGRPIWTSGRSPSLTRHPAFSANANTKTSPLFADTRPHLFGAESDAETRAFLRRSLDTAGVLPQTTLHEGDFRSWDPREIQEHARSQGHESGVILTNPPYGARLDLSIPELRSLYRDLGDWCREFPGYRAGFIIGEPQGESEPSRTRLFQASFGGKARVTKPLRNGPLRALFLLYDC